MGISIFIPKPPFPNVPKLPGVPTMPRLIGALAASIPSIIRAFLHQAQPGVLFHATKAAPIWGVFDDTGAQVIAPDSIMDFGYRAEWRVSDYPVQQGQFASYNKVLCPYEIAIRMVKGSDLNSRAQFETDCEFVAASMNLYTIRTPEKSYVGVNPTRVEFTRRETRGAFFVEAEMYFRQIKEETPQYSSTTAAAANTANSSHPPAIPMQALGLVQPLTVDPTTKQVVTGFLTGVPTPGSSPFFPSPLGP